MIRHRHRTSDPPPGSAKLGHISLSLFEFVSHRTHALIVRGLRLSDTRSEESLSILFRAVPGKVTLVTVEGHAPRLPDREPVAVLRFEVPGVAVAVDVLLVLHALIITAGLWITSVASDLFSPFCAPKCLWYMDLRRSPPGPEPSPVKRRAQVFISRGPRRSRRCSMPLASVHPLDPATHQQHHPSVRGSPASPDCSG